MAAVNPTQEGVSRVIEPAELTEVPLDGPDAPSQNRPSELREADEKSPSLSKPATEDTLNSDKSSSEPAASAPAPLNAADGDGSAGELPAEESEETEKSEESKQSIVETADESEKLETSETPASDLPELATELAGKSTSEQPISEKSTSEKSISGHSTSEKSTSEHAFEQPTEQPTGTDAQDDTPAKLVAKPAVKPASSPKYSPKAEQNGRPTSSQSTPRQDRARSSSIRRSRNASVALTQSVVNGAQAKPAKLFLQTAFDKIRNSKDAKRIPALHKAATRVMEAFEQHPNELPAPKLLLEPLRLVCVPPGSSNELKEVALDTLGQLFSLNYFAIVEDPTAINALLAEAVFIACDSWEAEGADQKVEVQIIKALTAAVVNEELIVHGSVLMRAVRQMYHIFVVTRSQINQNLAQGSLTQMVQAVFERVKMRYMPVSKSSSSVDITLPSSADARLVGASSAPDVSGNDVSGDDTVDVVAASASEVDAALTLKDIQSAPLPDMDEGDEIRSELENTTQDAGLLFRTLCRLSMKNIDESDVRSQPMRSKLLSLHLLHMILKHHISVFKNHRVVIHKSSRADVEPLAIAIKPYLVQAMAQNSLSPVPAAFEITSEIFWLVLANLRSEFKPELAVFFTEVYFTVMEMKTATIHQRMYFMTVLSRICTDPRLLVELYLNYDCDPAAPNVFEKLMELVSRLALKPAAEPAVLPPPGSRLSIDRQQIRVYDLNAPPAVAIAQLVATPPVSASALAASADIDAYRLKIAALESLVNVLRSLVLWSQRGNTSINNNSSNGHSDHHANEDAENGDAANKKKNMKRGSSSSSLSGLPHTATNGTQSRHRVSDSTSTLASHKSLNDEDDPDQFASRKQNKRALDAAVQEFNFNPARGLQKFLDAGLLSNIEDATEVAKLLLNTDGLDKSKLGDYLGKNGEFNQDVMVQFVSAMDFRRLTFVEALRQCLQRFRLPGEGQVIDRYMQTFAKKYFDDNSENGVHPDFASADAAWVLAMSVMMLNTDLHASALRRRRMTDEQFIHNNKGMNDGVDFRAELLMDIYNEIQNNEIKLDSEQAEVAIREETYEVASDAIANRAAEVFKSALPLEFADYYNASHAAHIRPMFELSWLAILAGISNPFSQLVRDEAALNVVLEGLEMALRIACHFDVALARVSFVQTLAQDTLLTHPAQMQRKNLEALHTLLRVSLAEADSLRESWYDVLVIISQLERVQLQAQDNQPAASNTAIPKDVKDALLSRELVVATDRIFAETASMTNEGAVFFVKALARVSLEEIQQSRASKTASAGSTRGATTASGAGGSSSGGTAPGQPRLFALQKMVDVCYYNSARIRMGWSEMWDAAMAEQFAKVLVDPNSQVVMFALDSLRQLSMRFLEIDEMPHFAFQREFLAPFGHALRHNKSPSIKVLGLECLTQIVRTRTDKLKSGWEAIFGAVAAAAEVHDTSVLEAAYSLLLAVPTEDRVPPGFLDACSTLAEQPEAKIALHAVEILHRIVNAHPHDISLLQSVLKHFSAIALQGKDLEVRGRCLENLFKILNENGRQFQREDWNEVFTNSLGPLFSVLHGQTTRRRTHHQHRTHNSNDSGNDSGNVEGSTSQRTPVSSPHRTPNRSPNRSPTRGSTSSSTSSTPNTFNELLAIPSLPPKLSSPSASSTSLAGAHNPRSRSRSPSPLRHRSSRAREDMSLWLSSTMIQALKSLVALFGTYFDMLEHALDTFFLPLLRTCILQENDAVSRMGNSCLQVLVHDNAARLTKEHWHQITTTFVQLFRDTTATQLMDRSVIEGNNMDAAELFRLMTAKTMQALLLMSSVRELLVASKPVFDKVPVAEILRITTRLRMSHQFAREFNHQHDLRLELYQRGFFRQTPNLLHQESQAGQTYISISMRLFKDSARFEADPAARQDLAEELIPFCNELLSDYNHLKESEPRHVSKFLPIVESILKHISDFDDADFKQCAPTVYLHVIDILSKSMTPALRESVQRILHRVADVWVLPPEQKTNASTNA